MTAAVISRAVRLGGKALTSLGLATLLIHSLIGILDMPMHRHCTSSHTMNHRGLPCFGWPSKSPTTTLIFTSLRRWRGIRSTGDQPERC
ncbi:hypothetical protein HDV57DRAFT_151197 [Trichoderma longibrachiatum]